MDVDDAKLRSQVGSHSVLDGTVMALTTHQTGSALISGLELCFGDLSSMSWDEQHGVVNERYMAFRVV